jgi:hypothetical protein
MFSFKPQPLHPERKIPGTGFSIPVIRISTENSLKQQDTKNVRLEMNFCTLT